MEDATARQAIRKRRVRLFRIGRDQAVLVPRAFELPDGEAVMRKEGDQLIIEPPPVKSLLDVLSTLQPLDEEFPLIDDQVCENA